MFNSYYCPIGSFLYLLGAPASFYGAVVGEYLGSARSQLPHPANRDTFDIDTVIAGVVPAGFVLLLDTVVSVAEK